MNPGNNAWIGVLGGGQLGRMLSLASRKMGFSVLTWTGGDRSGAASPADKILDKPFGNIKDYNFDFMKLWNNDKGNETRKWIKDTKCNCHYECIYTYNLVSSPKYSAKLATKVLSNKLRGLVKS